jgi:hypothetical protein
MPKQLDNRPKQNSDLSTLHRQKENKVRNYYNRLLNFTSTNDTAIIKKYSAKSYKNQRTKKQKHSEHRLTSSADTQHQLNTSRMTQKKMPVILND